jgi:glycosyltransferase involved in cell wall biosynthesis
MSILLPSLDIGGLASLGAELGTAATSIGVGVNLITLYESGEDANSTLTVSSLKIPPQKRGFYKPVIAIRRIKRMYKLLSNDQPDVIICLDPSSAFVCIILRLRFTKFKLYVGCYTPLALLKRSDVAIIRLFYQFAHLVVAPSVATGDDLKNLNTRINLRIISNPFSSGSIVCSINNPQKEKIWDCLYLGRLSREKGVSQVIQMAEMAPDLKFCIAGNGPEKNHLNELIEKRNIKNVEMLGWQSPSDCLPSSRVLLLPSIHETFGIVIVESWLHGVPVIAFANADGPRELLTSMKGGALVREYENCGEWVLRIREQLRSPLEDDFLNKTLEKYSAHRIILDWLKT